MAATEAVALVKNESNRKEDTAFGTEILKLKEDVFNKALAFALPAYAEDTKLSHEGLERTIEMLKDAGSLKKNIKIEEFVDERYYAK